MFAINSLVTLDDGGQYRNLCVYRVLKDEGIELRYSRKVRQRIKIRAYKIRFEFSICDWGKRKRVSSVRNEDELREVGLPELCMIRSNLDQFITAEVKKFDEPGNAT